MEEVLYERLTPSDFEARLRKAPIAYLPLGTLEWHGKHLPLGSDFLQREMILPISKGIVNQLVKIGSLMVNAGNIFSTLH